MSKVYNNEYVLDLPVEEASRLYLEPAVVANNPLQNELGLFRTVFSKRKVSMTHLRSNKNNLQPKAPCDVWNPTVRFGLRPETIQVTDYELNGEQCPDEFEASCLREMRRPLGEGTIPTFGGTPEMDAFKAAMVRLTARSLTDDIYKVIWFSDANIAEKIKAGFYGENPYPNDPASLERLITMLSQQSGIWSEIEARTRTTNDQGRIAYVDTNNGTAAGNATRTENITDFMDEMMAQASPLLQGWFDQANPQGYGRPMYLLDGKLFQAYKRYLRSTNTEASHQFIIQGNQVRDTLEYDGYLVVHVREWDSFDAEMGRAGSTARAILTVQENFTILANMNNPEGQPGSGLIIQQSPLLKDKGKFWMYADYGLGMGIAQPELIVAGYNSSTTFA